jgi:hypothetical protein
MSKRMVQFSIYRYDPDKDDAPYMQDISVELEPTDRKLLDALIEERQTSKQPLARASSGSTTFTFTPDPKQNFNREFTDYFVQGRQADIGAFDTPKNPGQPIGFVTQVGPNWVELALSDPAQTLHNGDGLCYYDAKGAAAWPSTGPRPWMPDATLALGPSDPITRFNDLRRGVEAATATRTDQDPDKNPATGASVWLQLRHGNTTSPLPTTMVQVPSSRARQQQRRACRARADRPPQQVRYYYICSTLHRLHEGGGHFFPHRC